MVKKEGVVAGYSLRQAFSQETDPAYNAAMTVIKASHQHVTNHSFRRGCLDFAFPVIVVDSPLIRCTLDASGQMELQEVEQGEFLFTAHEVGTCIRVVTVDYLPAFAKDAWSVSEQLKAALADEEEKVREASKQRGEMGGGSKC